MVVKIDLEVREEEIMLSRNHQLVLTASNSSDLIETLQLQCKTPSFMKDNNPYRVASDCNCALWWNEAMKLYSRLPSGPLRVLEHGPGFQPHLFPLTRSYCSFIHTYNCRSYWRSLPLGACNLAVIRGQGAHVRVTWHSAHVQTSWPRDMSRGVSGHSLCFVARGVVTWWGHTPDIVMWHFQIIYCSSILCCE